MVAEGRIICNDASASKWDPPKDQSPIRLTAQERAIPTTGKPSKIPFIQTNLKPPQSLPMQSKKVFKQRHQISGLFEQTRSKSGSDVSLFLGLNNLRKKLLILS